jgi:hypothetical protein
MALNVLAMASDAGHSHFGGITGIRIITTGVTGQALGGLTLFLPGLQKDRVHPGLTMKAIRPQIMDWLVANLAIRVIALIIRCGLAIQGESSRGDRQRNRHDQSNGQPTHPR